MAAYRENGGFCNAPKAQYSQQTHSLLKEMMQESKLTNFQQRHLQKQMRGGDSLPSQLNPTSSATRKAPKPKPKPPKYLNPRNHQSNIRTKEAIEATGAYERPEYDPGYSHQVRNGEKEKDKLSNMMAYGEDIDPHAERRKRAYQARHQQYEEEPIKDRFDELQEEIDERRDFLSKMQSAGQGEKHRGLIETQISQAIREMELIDKKRTQELEALIAAKQEKNNG